MRSLIIILKKYLFEKIHKNMTVDRWIAIGAMIASIAAVFVAVSSNSMQQKHMKLSVKPIPSIIFQQTSENLAVFLKNVGIGPLILRRLSYKTKDGKILATIVDPEDVKTWKAGEIILFELDLESAIASGESLRLVYYDATSQNNGSPIQNQALRTILDKVIVKLEFTDIYDSEFDSFEYELIARNILKQ